jgi:Spy/CpxP family protein refolding chaperone
MFPRAVSFLLLNIFIGIFASPVLAAQHFWGVQTPTHNRVALNKDNDKLYEKLNLSPDQIRQMNALHQQSAPEIKKRLAALNNAKKELLEMQASNASAAAIQAKQTQITTLKRSLADARLKYSKNMQSILTSEQWTKLQKIRQERRAQRSNE